MNLQQRINLLSRLGEHMLANSEAWQQIKEKASRENPWFIPAFIESSVTSIAHSFLQKDILEEWTAPYKIAIDSLQPRTVGIVMAGNIPLVGFHDLLSVFITGHKAVVKLSSKDNVLISYLVETLIAWEPAVKEFIFFADRLNGCDAYIATGSNTSASHFEYYFQKYPHIIRRNRTAVAVLTGHETDKELEGLADDVYMYFGLGCRNVTKIYVPENYDFIPLLSAFKKYNWLSDHHKYRNNYDYNLALHLLNRNIYMSNESILLAENSSFFSPISQLNYEYYPDKNTLITSLQAREELQCIAGTGLIPFGNAQKPAIHDYADGVNTLDFLTQIP
jgi:hypothetical protein